MRKLFFVFVLFASVAGANAADNILKITEQELNWNDAAKQRVVCNDTIAYIAFNDQMPFKVIPDIQVSPSGNKLKGRLNDLLYADKAIFMKGYKNKTSGNATYSGPFMQCGEMVDDQTGTFLSLSHISVSPDSLPVAVTHNGKKMLWYAFDHNDAAACNFIRQYALGYKSPEIKKDTINATDLSQLVYDVLPLASNDIWKVSCLYYVNGIEVSPDGGKIILPNKEVDLSSIMEKGSIKIERKVTLDHSYFSHQFTEVIADQVICRSEPTPWYKCHWVEMILVVSALVLFFLFLKIFHRLKRPDEASDNIDAKLDNREEPAGDDETAKIVEESDMVDEMQPADEADAVSKKNEGYTSSPVPSIPADTEKELHDLRESNKKKDEQIKALKERLAEADGAVESLEQKNKSLSEQLATKDSAISSLEKNKKELSEKLSGALKENKKLSADNDQLLGEVKKLRGENDGNKATIDRKDKVISLHLQKIKSLEDKLASISRQNMYILQIDDVLKEVNDSILSAVEKVEDEELRKKIVNPLLNGVPGLDEGLTTYYKRWQDSVMNVQHAFFGKDLYEMSNAQVKAKLVSGFLKNLAQGDTFSKLTRLYMYIQADWINVILIKAGFDVDKIEQIFGRLKLLFNDFGIEIVYPRLFVDKMNDQLYTFDPRCDVFKLFPISEEMRTSYASQSDLIVDVIQIGVKIASENYVRKAIVSIPNF